MQRVLVDTSMQQQTTSEQMTAMRQQYEQQLQQVNKQLVVQSEQCETLIFQNKKMSKVF